jgi:membrane protein involved in colicin uptake
MRVDHSSNHNATLTQTEPAARSISATPNNRPSDVEERQGPADSHDYPGQDSKDEPDYGQIVRELHRLKQERKMQEQKIEAGRNSLPDVDNLTRSASDAQRAVDRAQRAADEAQRLADVAQCAAETANKAVEDAEAKQSQLVADELYFERLTEDSNSLRAQLDID